MSQQEFDQQDQQAMQLANRETQKKIVAASESEQAMEQQRRILWTAIQILICILVAALFVAAMVDAAFVVFLANVGVLISGMVAAVKIDRVIRRWKKEGRV